MDGLHVAGMALDASRCSALADAQEQTHQQRMLCLSQPHLLTCLGSHTVLQILISPDIRHIVTVGEDACVRSHLMPAHIAAMCRGAAQASKLCATCQGACSPAMW